MAKRNNCTFDYLMSLTHVALGLMLLTFFFEMWMQLSLGLKEDYYSACMRELNKSDACYTMAFSR